MVEYYGKSYGCPSRKDGLGDTGKSVIIKSRVTMTLVGKGPASASAVAWTMYQKYANGPYFIGRRKAGSGMESR